MLALFFNSCLSDAIFNDPVLLSDSKLLIQSNLSFKHYVRPVVWDLYLSNLATDELTGLPQVRNVILPVD